MHNKSWISDNRIALVGGRNLGDEYFGASDEVNFVDLDFAMVGPVARDASASFDRYWNSPLAYPMDLLDPQGVNEASLAELRTRIAPRVAEARASKFARELRDNGTLQRLISGDWPMQWSSEVQFIADDPLKALGQGTGVKGSEVVALLGPAIKESRERLSVISPYFVPGPAGTEALVGIDRNGSRVRVLTNSLAANDVAMVYGGYSKWRKPLLEGGVELWELKPGAGAEVESSMFGSSGASLHTKALAIDGRRAFVGSYNLDPRSTSLNCEQGVLVTSPAIAVQLEALFEEDIHASRSWSVTLADDGLRWTDEHGTVDSTPSASFGRRFQAMLARILPISSQL
jgi:putative cardiolipin synthase